jgi:hypothetical protein
VARKVEVKLLDDIDGSQADETVPFAIDGTSYEIDLSAKHAKELRSVLDRFVGSARKVGRGVPAVAGARAGRAAAPARSDRAQNKAIREWAKRKKIELSDRGRIPRSIVEQYEAEAGR